jgi:hypothetical protein
VNHAGFALPQAYLDFLRISNGGEGELPVQPYWFQICRAEPQVPVLMVWN